jgi:hypothetical protein
MAEPGILAGLQEELEEEGLDVTSGFHPLILLRLLALGFVVIPRYLMGMFFPDQARKTIFAMTDKLVLKLEKDAEGISGLHDAMQFKQKTLKKLFPTIFLEFIPRMGVGFHPLLLLFKLAEKLPDGESQVLGITVSTLK